MAQSPIRFVAPSPGPATDLASTPPPPSLFRRESPTTAAMRAEREALERSLSASRPAVKPVPVRPGVTAKAPAALERGPLDMLTDFAGDSARSLLGRGTIGTGEGAVGLANIATALSPANIGARAASALLGEKAPDLTLNPLLDSVGYQPQVVRDYIAESDSDALKRARAEVEKAKGFIPTVEASILNPSTIIQSAIESAPSMYAGQGIASGALKMAPGMAPILASALGEGALTAGQNAEQTRQESGTLTPGQAGAAVAAGGVTAGISRLSGRFADEMGWADPDTLILGGRAAAGSPRNIASRIVGGAITEGAEEGLQSPQEQAFQNLAQGRPLGQGVMESAAQGMLTGGLMGAGSNVMPQRKAQTTDNPLDSEGLANATAGLPEYDAEDDFTSSLLNPSIGPAQALATGEAAPPTSAPVPAPAPAPSIRPSDVAGQIVWDAESQGRSPLSALIDSGLSTKDAKAVLSRVRSNQPQAAAVPAPDASKVDAEQDKAAAARRAEAKSPAPAPIASKPTTRNATPEEEDQFLREAHDAVNRAASEQLRAEREARAERFATPWDNRFASGAAPAAESPTADPFLQADRVTAVGNRFTESTDVAPAPSPFEAKQEQFARDQSEQQRGAEDAFYRKYAEENGHAALVDALRTREGLSTSAAVEDAKAIEDGRPRKKRQPKPKPAPQSAPSAPADAAPSDAAGTPTSPQAASSSPRDASPPAPDTQAQTGTVDAESSPASGTPERSSEPSPSSAPRPTVGESSDAGASPRRDDEGSTSAQESEQVDDNAAGNTDSSADGSTTVTARGRDFSVERTDKGFTLRGTKGARYDVVQTGPNRYEVKRNERRGMLGGRLGGPEDPLSGVTFAVKDGKLEVSNETPRSAPAPKVPGSRNPIADLWNSRKGPEEEGPEANLYRPDQPNPDDYDADGNEIPRGGPPSGPQNPSGDAGGGSVERQPAVLPANQGARVEGAEAKGAAQDLAPQRLEGSDVGVDGRAGNQLVADDAPKVSQGSAPSGVSGEQRENPKNANKPQRPGPGQEVSQSTESLPPKASPTIKESLKVEPKATLGGPRVESAKPEPKGMDGLTKTQRAEKKAAPKPTLDGLTKDQIAAAEFDAQQLKRELASLINSAVEENQTIHDALSPFYYNDLFGYNDSVAWADLPEATRKLAQRGGPPSRKLSMAERGKKAQGHKPGWVPPSYKQLRGLDLQVEDLVSLGWLPRGSTPSDLVDILLSDRPFYHPDGGSIDAKSQTTIAEENTIRTAQAVADETGIQPKAQLEALIRDKKNAKEVRILKALAKLDPNATQAQMDEARAKAEFEDAQEPDTVVEDTEPAPWDETQAEESSFLKPQSAPKSKPAQKAMNVEKTAAGDQMLLPGGVAFGSNMERKKTEGREALGPLFQQEEEAAKKADAARQKSIGDDDAPVSTGVPEIKPESFEVMPDGSGAPAVFSFGGLRFSFDYLGEIKSNALRAGNAFGNAARSMRESAIEKMKASYRTLIDGLPESWKNANHEMYPEGPDAKGSPATETPKLTGLAARIAEANQGRPLKGGDKNGDRRIKDAAKRADAKEDAEASKAEPKKSIGDVGEKIGGAKKDLWSTFKDKMSDALGMDLIAQPLSKSWPEPDYDAMIRDGADPWSVGFIRAVRDEVPPKPQKAWRAKQWAGQVEQLRKFAFDLLNGRYTKAQLQEKIAEKPFAAAMKPVTDRAELYALVGHEKSLHGVRIASGDYSVFNGQKFDKSKTIWTVEKKAPKTSFSNWPKIMASGDTRAEALDAFKAAYPTLDVSPKKQAADFIVYSYRGKPGFYIGKKISGKTFDLAGPFDNVKEARAYKDAEQDALLAKLEKIKDVPLERRPDNRPRVGEDHRQGKDITADEFKDAFGFRGVEFGNWVEQGKRQASLNEAYDALMDMAAILDIPPKAISLNGELGLAFGARGGGQFAAAHYESGKVVINLTKTKGAGSLGHEWWHALDNYFSRARGAKDGFMTTSVLNSGGANGDPAAEKVRLEMLRAYGQVRDKIRETAIKARASKLDAKRSGKAYWTTGHEMSARAFESYLISKLQDQNGSNDYLANIVDEDTWNAAASMGFELSDSYPYPTAGEIPSIRAAFDNFFDVIESKETDKGVALFERKPAAPEFSRPAFYSALERSAEQMKQPMMAHDAARFLLDSKRGAKAAEAKWTGLDDFLGVQWQDGKMSVTDPVKARRRVTPAEIQDFLKANAVTVTEVTKGDKGGVDLSVLDAAVRQAENDLVNAQEAEWGTTPGEAMDSFLDTVKDKDLGEKQSMVNRVYAVNANGLIREDALKDFAPEQKKAAFAWLDAVKAAEKRNAAINTAQTRLYAAQQRLDRAETQDDASGTKFGQYQIPGGTNYREVLLTLPEKRRTMEVSDTVNRWNVFENGQKIASDVTNARALEMTGGKEGSFRSSHFDEPNILAHVRFNERVVDGKKVLFLEEVQGDWPQAIRRQRTALDKAVSERFSKIVSKMKAAGVLSVDCS